MANGVVLAHVTKAWRSRMVEWIDGLALSISICSTEYLDEYLNTSQESCPTRKTTRYAVTLITQTTP